MDLYQLRYFLEVARHLSFTRAARSVHVSVPAISRSVTLLERSLKRKLFVRSQRRVTLTADGELLKARAERVFDDLERAELDLHRGAGPAEVLRIGSREMITNYLLPGPLHAFEKKHPGTRFGLYELGPRELAEALKRDQVDFGFFYAPIPDPGLEGVHLGRVRSHVYAAKRLAGTLGDLPFIAPRYFGSDAAAPSIDGYPDETHPRRILYEGEFLETHRRFVVEGLAAAVLPDFVIREEFRAGKVRRLKGPHLGREIYFFKRTGRPLPHQVDEFVDAVRKAVRKAS